MRKQEMTYAIDIPYRFTGKERDEETGLYYYGARYLDSKASRWLSTDPAMGDYIPGAPVDDEARKRNQSLPGQGGVFNLVNLHLYHYAGNNPVKHIDPDGKSDDEFDKFMMFLEEQDVKREFPNEAYKHEKIADNWNDLPESVKKYEPGTLWGNTVDDMGDHDHNQRLPGGYHLSEDKNYPGVYVHHDVIDPLKRPSETLDHKLFEADMAPDSSESRVDKYPDWK